MSTESRVLAAYHRAIWRHEKRAGESYPGTRATSIDVVAGTIHGTTKRIPWLVATFTLDAMDQPHINLVPLHRLLQTLQSLEEEVAKADRRLGNLSST